MIRILVCFKTVYDLEHAVPQELCDLRDGKLNPGVFGRRLGNYDEAALENALRIVDEIKENKEEVVLHGVTIGEKDTQFGKELYALGFQKITYVQIPEEEDLTYQPELAAAILTEYVTKECGYDMIFMGKQAGMGENAMTPYLLAEGLKMPCVTEVYSIERTPRGMAVVSQTERRTVRRVVTKPAVYVIGEAQHPYLRMATLREKLAAKEKEISYIQTELPRVQMHSLEFQRLLYESQEKQCQMIEGGTAREKAQKLWDMQMKGLVMS